MATTHGKASFFQFHAVDLSSYLNDISLARDIDMVETTTFGAAAKTYAAGLPDGKFSVSGLFDGAALDLLIAVDFVAATAYAFEYRESSATASAANPKFTGNAFVASYSIKAGVGDMVSADIEFQVTGAILRAIS